MTTLDPHTLDDVLDTILDTGQTLGVAGRAKQVVADLRERVDAVALGLQGRDAPRVFVRGERGGE